MTEHIPHDVLQRVIAAQEQINSAVKAIGAELDAVLLRDGNFNHLTVSDLESCIRSLPDGCFYKIDLKRAWRIATEKRDAVMPERNP